MIAVDTSSLIAYLSGADGRDADLVDFALEHSQAILPPVVVAELVSDPALPDSLRDLFAQLPLLAITDGCWFRAGLLRARVISKGRRGRLADSLGAQACLDHDVPLVTRDGDFRYLAEIAGLKLLP